MSGKKRVEQCSHRYGTVREKFEHRHGPRSWRSNNCRAESSIIIVVSTVIDYVYRIKGENEENS